MNTTTSTTQNAPAFLNRTSDAKWIGTRKDGFAFHGYCTLLMTDSIMSDAHYLYDIYCQIDGEEILMRRSLRNLDACAFINYANAAIYDGEEI